MSSQALPVRSMAVKASAEHAISPQEMIVHESIKGLLTEMADLKARCDSLETRNVEIEDQMDKLQIKFHHDLQRSSSQDSVTGGDPAQSNGTLVTCASSDVTKVEANGHRDFMSVQNECNNLTQILAHYKTLTDNQEVRLQEIEKLVENKSRDQTAMKGRLGSLEKKLREFVEEYEDSATIKGNNQSNGNFPSKSEVASWLTDDLQQLQLRLTNHEVKCEEEYNVLVAAVQGSSTTTAAPNVHPYGADDAESKRTKSKLAELHFTVSEFKDRLRNSRHIDEASTPDALHILFHQLTAIMAYEDSKAIHCEGPFQATPDEAFFLRDRVLRRLALFDNYGKALREAQAAKAHLDF